MTTTDVIKRLQEIESKYGVLNVMSYDSMDESIVDGVDIEILHKDNTPYSSIAFAEEGERFYKY